MNKNWVHFHLREALEELNRTLSEVESNPDYDEVEFEVAYPAP